MKGLILFVAVAFGAFASNAVFAQEPPPQSEMELTISSAVSPEINISNAIATTVTESCCNCKRQTLVGASQLAVKRVVARSRCAVKTLWSKRPQLLHRCKCCR